MRRASRDFVRALQSDGHKADSGAEVKVRLQICIKVCDVGGHSKPRESRRGVQEGSVSRAEQREGLRHRAARACACAPVRPRSSSRPHRESTPWESAAGGQPRGPVAQPERALGPYIYRLMRAEAPCHDTYQAFDDPPNKTGYRGADRKIYRFRITEKWFRTRRRRVGRPSAGVLRRSALGEVRWRSALGSHVREALSAAAAGLVRPP